jgi:hypothetical protein
MLLHLATLQQAQFALRHRVSVELPKSGLELEALDPSKHICNGLQTNEPQTVPTVLIRIGGYRPTCRILIFFSLFLSF